MSMTSEERQALVQTIDEWEKSLELLLAEAQRPDTEWRQKLDGLANLTATSNA